MGCMVECRQLLMSQAAVQDARLAHVVHEGHGHRRRSRQQDDPPPPRVHEHAVRARADVQDA